MGGGDLLYHSILSPSPPPFSCYLYYTPFPVACLFPLFLLNS